MRRLGQNNRPSDMDDDNPKTLPLEQLVKQVDAHLIRYYLNQIATYLKNSKRDLLFPMISPNLDALLVRMIRDERNLRSLLDLFDDQSKELAVQILDSLNKNEDVFKLVHSYEGSRVNRITLVYKKMYISKTSDSDIDQSNKTCPNNQNAEEPAIADAPPQYKPDALHDFKPKWLNTLISFIRDKDIKSVEFPDLAITEAEMLSSAITTPQVDISRLQPLWQALKEFNITQEIKITYIHIGATITLLMEKSNRKATRANLLYSSTARPRKRRVCPNSGALGPDHVDKEAPDAVRVPSLPTNESIPPPAYSETDATQRAEAGLSKTQKCFNKKKQLVGLVGQVFAKSALEMINRFMALDGEGSVVFRNATEEQGIFLQSACSMAKTKRMHPLFNDENQKLMKTLAKHVNASQHYDLKMEAKKLDKETKMRDIVIVKEPKYTADEDNINTPSTSKTNRQIKPKKPTNVMSVLIKNDKMIEKPINSKTMEQSRVAVAKVIDNAKGDSVKALGDLAKAIDQAKSIADTQNALKTTKILKEINDKNTTSLNFVNRTDNTLVIDVVSAPIQSSFASGLDGDFASTNSPSNSAISNAVASISTQTVASATRNEQAGFILPTEMSDGRPLPARKAKLLEAMSVPIKSEKGLRMMRQMGWEGGPLGLRGEGITEPIIPDLHIAEKAGLGHVKAPSPSVKNKTFRLDILRNIHVLIIEEPLKRTISYPNQLSKKERGFLLNAVRGFSKRSAMQMNDAELQAGVQLVMEEMLLEPRLQISALLHSDKKSITLSKNDISATPNTPPSTPPPEDVISIIAEFGRANYIHIDMVTHIGQLVKPGLAAKSAKGLGHRIVLLAKILHLIKGQKQLISLRFEYSLTMRQIHYAKEMIACLNVRSKLSHSPPEDYLFGEIMRYIGPYQLTIEFTCINKELCPEQYTMITLHKKRSKRPQDFETNPNDNKVETINNNDQRVLSKEIYNVDDDDKVEISKCDSKISLEDDLIGTGDDVIGAGDDMIDVKEDIIEILSDETDEMLQGDITAKDLVVSLNTGSIIDSKRDVKIKNDGKINEVKTKGLKNNDSCVIEKNSVKTHGEVDVVSFEVGDKAIGELNSKTLKKSIAKVSDINKEMAIQRINAKLPKKFDVRVVDSKEPKITVRLYTKKGEMDSRMVQKLDFPLPETAEDTIPEINNDYFEKLHAKAIEMYNAKFSGKLTAKTEQLTEKINTDTEKVDAKLTERKVTIGGNSKETRSNDDKMTEKLATTVTKQPDSKMVAKNSLKITQKNPKVTQTDAKVTGKHDSEVFETNDLTITEKFDGKTTNSKMNASTVNKINEKVNLKATETNKPGMTEKTDSKLNKINPINVKVDATETNRTKIPLNDPNDAKTTEKYDAQTTIKADEQTTNKNDAKLTQNDEAVVNDSEEKPQKRNRSNSDEPNNVTKKTKLEVTKYLCIAPDSYPIEEVDLEMVKLFQTFICNKADRKYMPLIECVGLKNGALIYGCHNENGRILIESVARGMNLKPTNITNLYKNKKRFQVNARINTFIDVNLKKLFDDLEAYNAGLSTDSWTVTDVDKRTDSIEMVVEIDGASYDYICQRGFGLYAGMDKVKFSVIWN